MVAGETMRTEYFGQSSPIDTIREPDMSRAAWEAQHRQNIVDRWASEPPLVLVQPLAWATIEYVYDTANWAYEMDEQPGETTLHFERRFLNDVLPFYWRSHPPDISTP